MDRERKKRNRLIKIAIIDLISAAAVVAIVLLLVAVVAGWRVGADFTLEHNGMVEISTTPTGATVTIDGQTIFGTTNLSKMLTGGEHEIVLTKEGYEMWSKTVTITPGWLLNLQYPRLIKQNRTQETVASFKDLKFFEISPDRKSILYAENNNLTWHYITNVDSDKIKNTTLDLSFLFDSEEETVASAKNNSTKNNSSRTTSPIKTFDVDWLKWNANSDKVLVKGSKNEYLLVNLKNLNDSINISESLNLDATLNGTVTKMEFLNNSGSELLALINSTLLKINLGDKTFATAVSERIEKFSVTDTEVIYVTEPNKQNLRYIKLYKDGDKDPHTIYTSEIKDDSLLVATSTYLGQKYAIFSVNNRFYVKAGDEFSSEMNILAENDLNIRPASLAISHNGEFFVLRNDHDIIVYDAEIRQYSEYTTGSPQTNWLDNYMMWGVNAGTLTTWDFDGTNLRTLVVDDADDHGAFISEGNKYLYYTARSDIVGYILKRERL